MAKNHAFCPSVIDSLEDRVVPSHAPTSVATLVESAVPLPPQVAQIQSVRSAFAEFLVDYQEAYTQILLAPGVGGLTNPSANRAAFDAQVKTALVALDEALTTAVSAQPGSTALASQFHDEILGSGPSSLLSVLDHLPTPSGTLQSASAIAATATQQVAETARSVTIDLRAVARPLVAQGGADADGADLSTPGPATATSAASAAPQKVRQAFTNFLTNYYSAVQHVLLAPGPDGSVNPTANRPAFDAEVSRAVATLSQSLSSTIGSLPGSSTLSDRVRAVLFGEAAGLSSRLKGVASPAGDGPTAVVGFRDDSSGVIGKALAAVMGDLAAYLRAQSPGR